jgi:hypothetical protein
MNPETLVSNEVSNMLRFHTKSRGVWHAQVHALEGRFNASDKYVREILLTRIAWEWFHSIHGAMQHGAKCPTANVPQKFSSTTEMTQTMCGSSLSARPTSRLDGQARIVIKPCARETRHRFVHSRLLPIDNPFSYSVLLTLRGCPSRRQSS